MSEPRVGMWHPDFADTEDMAAIGRYTALLGPFMQTYPGLSVDDYWTLSVSEHAAMLEWLHATEVLERPSA